MKKLLSIILAALILTCPLCSFATEAVQTLDWYFCDDPDYCEPWVYNYKGEVTLGENTLVYTEDDYCDYYTFNAENSGYYYVECNDEEIEWFAFPEEIQNGKAYFEAEGWFVSGSDIEKKAVYKLDAGETVLGIDYSWYAEITDYYSFKIEYLGNTITDIIVDEGALDNLIIDIDVYDHDYSYIFSDVEVVFSEEKSVVFPDEAVEIWQIGYDWSKGENEAVISYMEFEKNVIVTACELTNVITDVEFVNLDEYKNVQTSYNDPWYEHIYGAELVFTLADGTKIEADSNETEIIELNGREYYFYVTYEYNSSDDVDIMIAVEGIALKTYKCNVTKTTLAENTKYLFNDISTSIKDSMYYTRLAFSELLRFYDSSDFEDVIYEALWYFEYAAYCISEIFCSISFFADYYI